MAAGTLRTFVPEEVSLDWGGINFDGYAEGTFITAKRNSANSAAAVGADGSVGLTKIADKTGTIEITLMQNSETNLYLAKVQQEQDFSDDLIRANLVVTDASGSYLCTATNAHIMEAPEVALGAEQNEKTWVFYVERLEYTADRGAFTPSDRAKVQIDAGYDSVSGVSATINATINS